MIYECDSCGNTSAITWITEEEDYNEFGIRYCPFCGSLFDTFTMSKETWACQRKD